MTFKSAFGAAAAAVACIAGGCGTNRPNPDWPLPNGNLSGTRAAAGSSIDARTVGRLRVRWRFRFTARPSFSGIYASTPVVAGDTVYLQDLRSNVFALERSSGALRWERRYAARNDGPNGLAVAANRVYGATDSDAFALDASTGAELWHRHLTSPTEQLVDVAPIVWKGLVFVSTVGYPPSGRGAISALDSATGALRWKFVTIARPWRHPAVAGGGGIWYPVSIDGNGRLYAGTANPAPWGGSSRFPNGGAFPGPVPYTDSLLVLDAGTGRLLWHDQVTSHDIRDYDFEATPIVAGTRVFGAGKAGRVIAWDRATRRRLWETRVGVHRNDAGPLPRRRVTVCPGLLGGVETPIAFAADRLFVPVVDLCAWGSAVAREELTQLDPSSGRGRVVALAAGTGRALWERRFPSPVFGCATVANDVVFTSTYAGTVYALHAGRGTTLWHAQLRAGVNACPAVAGDLLLVGAGIRRPGAEGSVTELTAFGLS